MWAARAERCRPASVSESRREVRLNNKVPSFASILLTAFETVAFDSCNSMAAPANERICATLARIARPSRSGSLDIAKLRNNKLQRASQETTHRRLGHALPSGTLLVGLGRTRLSVAASTLAEGYNLIDLLPGPRTYTIGSPT